VVAPPFPASPLTNSNTTSTKSPDHLASEIHNYLLRITRLWHISSPYPLLKARLLSFHIQFIQSSTKHNIHITSHHIESSIHTIKYTTSTKPHQSDDHTTSEHPTRPLPRTTPSAVHRPIAVTIACIHCFDKCASPIDRPLSRAEVGAISC
jgi:hypothetical protein